MRIRCGVSRSAAVACVLLCLGAGTADGKGKPRRPPSQKLTAPESSVESVRPEEVAPEDRSARADAKGPSGGPGLPRPPPAAIPSDQAELAGLGEELRRAWEGIPQYSPVSAASRLTSGFGWRRSPLDRRREFHGGIDLAAPQGTPVLAPAAGIVERVFVDRGAGLVVLLAHGNGLQTLYGHLERALVAEGQDVVRGTPLATVGSTGARTTGPHLHYGVKLEGKYVNPRRYLFEAPGPVAVREARR